MLWEVKRIGRAGADHAERREQVQLEREDIQTDQREEKGGHRNPRQAQEGQQVIPHAVAFERRPDPQGTANHCRKDQRGAHQLHRGADAFANTAGHRLTGAIRIAQVAAGDLA